MLCSKKSVLIEKVIYYIEGNLLYRSSTVFKVWPEAYTVLRSEMLLMMNQNAVFSQLPFMLKARYQSRRIDELNHELPCQEIGFTMHFKFKPHEMLINFQSITNTQYIKRVLTAAMTASFFCTCMPVATVDGLLGLHSIDSIYLAVSHRHNDHRLQILLSVLLALHSLNNIRRHLT